MKKKIQSFESILIKAEKLFEKGKYLSAKKEFEKAGRISSRDNITEKLKICTKEIGKLKVKDLIKRGEKYTRKKKLRDALRCFEEARMIAGKDDGIHEKIEMLSKRLQGHDINMAARNAEAAGQYLKAAELYEKILAGSKKKDALILKRAVCLVKAERYEDAVSVFKGTSPDSHYTLYNYGFALAKTGQYSKCLNAWNNIAVKDNDFLKQKEIVLSMMAEDIYNRFDGAEDFAGLYKEGKYLLDLTGRQDLVEMVEYCKYAWIEELWKEEQYETIWELLFDFPATIDSALIALYAKICFKLAKRHGTHLSDLAMFWLTAVYNNELSGEFSLEEKEKETIRQKLIRMAEDLIKKDVNPEDINSEDETASLALTCWNIDKKLIENIHILARDHKDMAHIVCTPRFADLFGKSAQILRLIKKNKNFFKSTEDYLTTGCYYSQAGQSLYYLEARQYKKAFDSLPKKINPEKINPKKINSNEFAAYGIMKVKFFCGLDCIENGNGQPRRYFDTASIMFDLVPDYEKELIEKAMDSYKLDKLNRYEEALDIIHIKRPSKEIKEALSMVMSRRAVKMYNAEKINDKALSIILKKALALNPENEFALAGMHETNIDLEVIKLEKALSRNKMNKACKIAVESEYERVRTCFFEFMENAIKTMFDMDLEDNRKIFLLKDSYEWCARVDDSHPVLYDIGDMLRSLEQR